MSARHQTTWSTSPPGETDWLSDSQQKVSEQDRVGRPSTLCVELTLRCPLHCNHCSANAGPKRSERLSLSAFGSILANAPPLREIYLSGGEPFEHPELAQIVEMAKARADSVIIYSSGARLLENGLAPIENHELAKIAVRGLDRLDVSIYSVIPREHDTVTEVAGSFKLLMKTIANARSLGIAFGVHYVPLVDGGSRVRSVATLARELGACRFHALALQPLGRAGRKLEEFHSGFLQEVSSIPSSGTFGVLRSSDIRHALGEQGVTERDLLDAAFFDVQGSARLSEGNRALVPLHRLSAKSSADCARPVV
jgi:MoaA/NifB/PqqE/SkfB family radical SAM enzyme